MTLCILFLSRTVDLSANRRYLAPTIVSPALNVTPASHLLLCHPSCLHCLLGLHTLSRFAVGQPQSAESIFFRHFFYIPEIRDSLHNRHIKVHVYRLAYKSVE